MSKSSTLVPGTLDLLILRTLAPEPLHGWGIAQRIRLVSQSALQVGQGALYPALHRLYAQGWVRAEWRGTEHNRQARYYALTRAGRKHLEREQAQWERLSAAIGLVLNQE